MVILECIQEFRENFFLLPLIRPHIHMITSIERG